MNKFTYLIAISLLLTACNSNQPSNSDQTSEPTEQASTNQVEPKPTDASSHAFSIESLALSEAVIGDFPFFTAPVGAKYINNPKVNAFDFIVFVTPDSIFEVEGKTYRAWIQKDNESNTEISGRYLFKSYEDAILAAGGVKVFEGKLTGDRLKKYEALATYAGSDGSIDVYNEAIVSYAIRRADGNVYITFQKHDFPSSAIQIVQEKAFQQTIKK